MVSQRGHVRKVPLLASCPVITVEAWCGDDGLSVPQSGSECDWGRGDGGGLGDDQWLAIIFCVPV